MPTLVDQLTTSSAALEPLPWITDDECVARLAAVLEEHDSHRLDEVAQLIGRLAVPIEL